jgi:hypothetical protein
MYIPRSVLASEANFTKHATRESSQQIFQDKSVNKNTEPLLFNIEAAKAVTEVVVQGNSGNIKSANPQSIQSVGARDLLRQLNIAYANVPKDFSLMTRETCSTILENKNIMNSSEFAKIFNIGVTAIDKFPTNTDPFYKLDEGNLSNHIYETETMAGVIVNVPDLSKVAASVASLNLSNTYSGKSKYFITSEKV